MGSYHFTFRYLFAYICSFTAAYISVRLWARLCEWFIMWWMILSCVYLLLAIGLHFSFSVIKSITVFNQKRIIIISCFEGCFNICYFYLSTLPKSVHFLLFHHYMTLVSLLHGFNEILDRRNIESNDSHPFVGLVLNIFVF